MDLQTWLDDSAKEGQKNNYFSQRNVMEMEELLIKSNKSKNLKGVG